MGPIAGVKKMLYVFKWQPPMSWWNNKSLRSNHRHEELTIGGKGGL